MDLFKVAKDKTILLWGKIRRFYYGHFEGRKLKKKLAFREGECARCGTCCKLMFTCPFLTTHQDGSTSCMIHNKRPVNCRIFPADEVDLRDRDLVNPNIKCGYSFKNQQSL